MSSNALSMVVDEYLPQITETWKRIQAKGSFSIADAVTLMGEMLQDAEKEGANDTQKAYEAPKAKSFAKNSK